MIPFYDIETETYWLKVLDPDSLDAEDFAKLGIPPTAAYVAPYFTWSLTPKDFVHGYQSRRN